MTKNFFDDHDELLIPTPISKMPSKSLFSRLYGNNPKKSMMIIIPLILVILSATYFFYRVIKTPKIYNNSSEIAAAKTLENISEINANTYIDLDQIIVNLAASGLKQNYLKLILTLQFASDIETKSAQLRLPNIIDSFQTFLRELRASDLNGSGSILHLKEELIKRVNKITYPIVIKNILFKEMLVN